MPFSQVWSWQVLIPRPVYNKTASSGTAMHYRHQQRSQKRGQLNVLQKLTQQQLLQKVYHTLDTSGIAVVLLRRMQKPHM